MDCTKGYYGFAGEWYNYSELNLRTLWRMLGKPAFLKRLSMKLLRRCGQMQN
jgi:hypothetical protein